MSRRETSAAELGNKQMAGQWERVPSVVLHEIYLLLPTEDQLRASSTCRHWRHVFYQSFAPSKVTFRVRAGDLNSCERSLFLASCWGNKLRHAVVEFESTDAGAADTLADLLLLLADNCHLRSLLLRPSHCLLQMPPHPAFLDRKIMEPLRGIIEKSKRLESIDLGGLEDLAPYLSELVRLLSFFQGKHLQSLHASTLKASPQDYEIFDLDPGLFARLTALTELSLDFDYLTDRLLQTLSGQGRDLRVLSVNVHGIDEDYLPPSNQTWTAFSKQNSNCELRLCLLFSSEAVDFLSAGLLQPSMPLAQLKVLFCEKLNVEALHLLYDWFSSRLNCLWWVDIADENSSLDALDLSLGQPHPLVMVAWRCLHLRELVVIGYDQLDDNIIAISRLRGPLLKRLDIPESNIFFEEIPVDSAKDAKAKLMDEVSDSLQRTWAPLSAKDLPPALVNPTLESAIEFALASVQ
ncbi:F-box only protein 33 [Neocloeon triangulifer]|uniref:F-box only protein 33 n=1 Tax=Neocloeon triangulifer TaxID=2078957 RepID=UPI00286F60A6|nr:F-box only protein 33 [Neocloeon triangulifer]